MKTWTIGKRITLGFAAVIVIAIMLGGAGYYSAIKGARDIGELGLVEMPSVQNLQVIKIGGEKIASAQQSLLQWGLAPAVRAKEHESIAKIRENYGAAWKAYELLPKSAEDKKLWADLQAPWDQWRAANTEFFKMVKELEDLALGDPTSLGRQIQQFRGDHYALEALVSGLIYDKQTFEGHEDPTQCNFGKWRTGLVVQNPDLRESLSKIQTSHDKFHASVAKIKELAKAGSTDAAVNIYKNEMQPAAEATLGEFQRIIALGNKAQELETKVQWQLTEVCRPARLKAADILDQMIKMACDDAATGTANAQARAAFMKTFSLLTTIIGAVGAGLLAFFIARSIIRPISAIAAALGNGSDQVASAAGQVSSTSQSLAGGASEQAASIEETSASLEEISSMTQRNVQNVQTAKDFTSETRSHAESGAKSTHEMGQAMQGIRSASGEMRDAMNGIKEASNDVSKIIRTIDEIAFQTNLLALNAAVEAARAGEAGMGFAVVADEVRSLAQRSAKAAKETADLIETSVKRSEDGVRVTDKVVASVEEVAAKSTQLEQRLAEIVVKAKMVDEQVAQIASASQEQSQGISEVNLAVGQMDKVTQGTASSAEESAAAAEELNAQAELLKNSVRELLQLVGGVNSESAKHSHAKAPTAARGVPKSNSFGSRSKPAGAQKPVANKSASVPDDFDIPMPEPIGAGSAKSGFKDF